MSALKLRAANYLRMPLVELTTPKEGRLCIANSWWAITEDGQALFYKHHSSPQCNTNRSITERLGPSGTTPRFIEFAFVPHNCSDYCP